MEIYQAIILGIVQGLTEFIPVSSTAHLILIPWLFGWKGEANTLLFDVSLHGGTLFALLIYFRREWVEILKGDKKLLILLFIGSLPAAIIGMLLENVVSSYLRGPWIIVFTLITVGVIMLFSERKNGLKSFKDINKKDAIFVGAAQAIALIPGVSRSGITISAALLRQIKREDAAKYSFLLCMPIVTGAVVLEGSKIFKRPTDFDIFFILIGVFFSMISSLCVIRFLLWFFKSFSLKLFVYYRFAIAVIIILVLWLRG